MAIIGIQQPAIYQPPGSNQHCVQKGPFAEAATQTWLARSFVQITGTGSSAKLQRCAADATAIFGLVPDAAKGSATTGAGIQPPAAPFGLNHYPFDPRDVIFAINITNASLSGANIGASGVTFAGGGTSGVALAPGQQYGLITLTSGTYSGYQMLDVTETTAKVFEIVALAPGQSVDDNNPRVLVKVMPAALQG